MNGCLLAAAAVAAADALLATRSAPGPAAAAVSLQPTRSSVSVERRASLGLGANRTAAHAGGPGSPGALQGSSPGLGTAGLAAAADAAGRPAGPYGPGAGGGGGSGRGRASGFSWRSIGSISFGMGRGAGRSRDRSSPRTSACPCPWHASGHGAHADAHRSVCSITPRTRARGAVRCGALYHVAVARRDCLMGDARPCVPHAEGLATPLRPPSEAPLRPRPRARAPGPAFLADSQLIAGCHDDDDDGGASPLNVPCGI